MQPQDYNRQETTSDNLGSLNLTHWKIRTLPRKGDKMRLLVNLDKDQSVGFKNFKKMFKADEMKDEDFVRLVFLHGIQSMNEKAAKMMQEFARENKEALAASGIIVTEGDDGSIHLSEPETPDEE